MIASAMPLTFFFALFAAQPHNHAMPDMHHMHTDPGHQFLMLQARGPSADPAAVPHEGLMTSYEDWMLMAHGMAFVSQVVQTGLRGGDQLFSTNWAMGMAERPLGGGR